MEAGHVADLLAVGAKYHQRKAPDGRTWDNNRKGQGARDTRIIGSGAFSNVYSYTGDDNANKEMKVNVIHGNFGSASTAVCGSMTTTPRRAKLYETFRQLRP